MKNETLLDKALQNLDCAKILYKNLIDDDVYLNYVGYHIQQAVELSVKYSLEINGIDYPKTHDISQLTIILKDNQLDSLITDYIDEHAEMFTTWEAQTRYVLNYRLEERKIEKAIREVDDYLVTLQIKLQNNRSVGQEELTEEEDEDKL